MGHTQELLFTCLQAANGELSRQSGDGAFQDAADLPTSYSGACAILCVHPLLAYMA